MKRAAVCAFLWLAGLSAGLLGGATPAPGAGAGDAAAYLYRVMDQFHQTVDVYTDSHAAGHHFVMRGLMSSNGAQDAVPAMVEDWGDRPYRGIDCIKAQFKAKGDNWGGWYFLNGVLLSGETAPRENWGDYPNAGYDLRGAASLTFWVRGARGGEQVEFFCFGVGRHAATGFPEKPYPDSSAKISTGLVTLSPAWQQYSLELSKPDLSYVLGGFGWAANSGNNGYQDIEFYLDDIQFHKSRLGDSRFLVSYAAQASGLDFDKVLRNTAFTYDNAVALLSFVAQGNAFRAGKIADALCHAWRNDRLYRSGWLRNAYQGGDLALFPGWYANGYAATVRMSGWWNTDLKRWDEDLFQVSTHTGNVAWAMLGLLGYYEKYGGAAYLNIAREMGEWVEFHCRSALGPGGYTAGFEGRDPNLLPGKLTCKSTEHNLDLYAAFQRLFLITGESKWQERARHAADFVHQMWDPADGKFWTGTTDDGVTINQGVIPLDVQAWANLAFYQEARARGYDRALAYAELHHWTGSGYDFNTDKDGVWYEGTAQMAAAYAVAGQKTRYAEIIQVLRQAQWPDGSLPAASRDGLTTGFAIPGDGSEPIRREWLYYRRSHVGATAWLIFAEKGFNPFWKAGGQTNPGIFLLMD